MYISSYITNFDIGLLIFAKEYVENICQTLVVEIIFKSYIFYNSVCNIRIFRHDLFQKWSEDSIFIQSEVFFFDALNES